MFSLSVFQVITLFLLIAVSIEAIPVSENKAAIFLPEKPQGAILQDGYPIFYPTAPADLGVVFSQSYQQIVGGISTSLHAAVEYLTRLVGRQP